MRKHPLIALIAFTFVAASIFIGANGVSSINNSVPARATSHLNNGGSGPSMVATTNLKMCIRDRPPDDGLLVGQERT